MLPGGTELIGPNGNGGFILDGDVTFAITVGGVSYAGMDDFSYPVCPSLTFNNGVLTGVDFLLAEAGTLLSFGVGGACFRDAASNISEGTATFSFPDPVPEPASLALFGLGAPLTE